MDTETATKLIGIYGQAWITRDPDLILTIFTPDATYNDPHEPENRGHDAIRDYWVSKVVGQQKDISFRLLNVWVNGGNVIEEWEAKFTDTKRNMRIEMREVAIFTTDGSKFTSLREYYTSKKIPL